MRHIIRLSMLEIENIKNVQYGKIEFARGRNCLLYTSDAADD